MTHILQIDASARPGIRGQVPHGSHTRALTHRFVSQWRALAAQTDAQTHTQPATQSDAPHTSSAAVLASDAQALHVQYRDVGANPPAAIGANWVAAVFSPDATPAQRAHLAESDALIAELRAADVLVLGVPMYNFGPPAAFKAWVDNVVRVGQTFNFDEAALARGEDPYIPLLADKPRSVVLLTSRGDHGMHAGGPKAHLNHLDGAVQTALGLLGLTDWHSVAIECDEFGGDLLAQSVARAMAQVDALVAQLHAASTEGLMAAC